MKQVGLVVCPDKIRDEQSLHNLEAWFADRDIQVKSYCFATDEGRRSLQDTMAELDMIIVLGGDGALLGTARLTAGLGLPILGVNMGHLGFLTDMEMQDLLPNLDRLVQGDYVLEPRLMLETEVRRDGKPASRCFALNDAAITKGPLSRIITLETYFGDECLAAYRADGIIVSTPTGSTAYSLSAGGPIASPGLDLLIVTPICPQTLYARPFVVPDCCPIRIILKSEPSGAMLTIDGQVGFALQQGDEILVNRAEAVTNLVRLRNRSFFEIVRLKLIQRR